MKVPDNLPFWLRDPKRALPVAAGAVAIIVVAVYLPTRNDGAKPVAAKRIAEQPAAAPEVTVAPEDAAAAAPAAATTARKKAAPRAAPGKASTTLEAPRTRLEGTLGARRPSWYKAGVPFNPAAFGPRESWPGVTKDKIRLLFHMTKQSCGDNYSALVDQVLRFQSAWEKTVNPLLAYFNSRGVELYAGDPNDAEFKNAVTYFPSGSLFGRTIEPVFELDDGGPYCEEKARKNGDKAYQGGYGGPIFAAVGAGYGAERFILENMIGPCQKDSSKKCPMHVGSYWHTDGYFNEKRPYAWSHWSSSTRVVQGLASLMAERQRMSGGKVDFTDQNKGQPRKFGIITVDIPDNKEMVKEFIGLLAKFNIKQPTGAAITEAADVIYTPIPLSGRQQVMTQACAQFKVGNYTTIFHLGSVLDPIFMFPACTGQQYFPEWPISSIGYFDVGTAGRAYKDLDPAPPGSKHMDHARGESTLQSKDNIVVEPEKSQHGLAWSVVCPAASGDPKDQAKPHHPDCPKDDNGNWRAIPPDDLALWYYPIAVLQGLMAAAGPALTPPNVEKYIEEVCNPCAKNAYITITFGYNRNDHTSVDDHVGWKWNPDRSDVSADRSDWGDSGKTPPKGGYEVDTSVRGGLRCFDFTNQSSCHS